MGGPCDGVLIMAGGFGLQYGGWRTLLPEDSTGRINEQKVRNAIQNFHRDVGNRGMGMEPPPWKANLRESQRWGRMVDAKMKDVARKNALIDAAERGDEDAIRELKDILAREKNMMSLRQEYPLPKSPKAIQGISKS